MRVLMVGLNYAPEPTGIAPYTTSLSEGLAKRGHQVRVLTTMPHYPEWRVRTGFGGWRRTERQNGVVVQRVKHYIPARPSGVRRLLSELSFGLRALVARWGRPDVVVMVSPALFASSLVMLRARFSGLPAVLWVQDLYSLGMVETASAEGRGTVVKAIQAIESATIKRASGVCVIHDRFAATATALGADAGRVEVVRNWSHLGEVPRRSRNETRAALGWGRSDVIALHTGAMGKKQDLRNVVEAARLADERGVPVRFVLVGNGGERAALEQAAQGVAAIEFVDPLPGEQFQAALDAADVLVVNEHAGLREMAVPSKLTSYFSSGRPIIAATDAQSLTALEVRAAGAGLRVQPMHPGALLDGVLAIAADRAWGDRLGASGRRYRDQRLSAQAAIDQYGSWLEHLVSGGVRAAAVEDRDDLAPTERLAQGA